jgi:hypothetical protein
VAPSFSWELATFLLIEVELRPAAGPTHPGHASIIAVIVLFALFGGATFWMRWYFARREQRKSLAPREATSADVE